MAQTNLVMDTRSASSVPQSGAKAQKAAKAETQTFETMLQEEALAGAAKSRAPAATDSPVSRNSALSQAGAEEDASSSETAQTDQTQPAASGFAFLAPPPVFAALNYSNGDAAASSVKSGDATALDAVAVQSASQAAKGLGATSTLAVEKTAADAANNADALALTSSPEAASWKSPSVTATVVSARTYLAPGASLSLKASAEDMAAVASDTPGGKLKTPAPTTNRSEAEAASTDRSVAAAQSSEANAVDAPQSKASFVAAVQSNDANVAYAARTDRAQADPTRRHTNASRSVEVTDSSSAASETDPIQVAYFAKVAKQGANQDAGSNMDRSSGKDQSNTEAQSPLQTASVIPVGSGSASALTPSQQIARAVEAAIPMAVTAGAKADGTLAASASLQPVKTIALALTPSNLGGVEIELSLTGGKLDVKIRATEPETAKLLRKDDAALEKLLQSAGVSLQGLSIQVSQQAVQSFQTGAQTAQYGQASADSSTANGGRDQGARQGAGDKQADKGSDQGSTNGRASAYRRGGSLYL
jgi:chemotaxis protein MotD